MNQRRKGLLDPSQNRAGEEKGGKEWDKKKVLPSSKHRSLAEAHMPTNEVTAMVKQKGKRRKEEGVLTMKEWQFHAESAGVSNLLLDIKKKNVSTPTTVPLPVN